MIDGWLRERAEARDKYTAGLFYKDKAAILEQEREDVVTIRVGTIAPGERVSVRLTLCTRLSYSDGEIFSASLSSSRRATSRAPQWRLARSEPAAPPTRM